MPPSIANHLGFEAAGEIETIARHQATRVAHEHVPGAVRAGLIEGDADPRLTAAAAAHGFELGWNHGGVVGDEQVARAQEVGQLGHDAVAACVVRHQQARSVARARGLLRDQRFGEVEIEVVGEHEEFLDLRDGRRPGLCPGPAKGLAPWIPRLETNGF